MVSLSTSVEGKIINLISDLSGLKPPKIGGVMLIKKWT
jgi:hypothetical protein